MECFIDDNYSMLQGYCQSVHFEWPVGGLPLVFYGFKSATYETIVHWVSSNDNLNPFPCG